MAWYEAHQTLGKHPKTLKLSRLIKRDRRYAVGLLHDLFSWGLDCAKKDGTLPGMNAEDIASALDFSGKAGEKIVDALLESGYLENAEGTFKIHDWYDYAGKLVDQREDAKRRKKEWKERRENAEGTVPEQFQNGLPPVPEQGKGEERTLLPYPTVPNQFNNNTLPRARVREEDQDDGFQEFWAAYPRKSGDIRSAYMEYMRVTETVKPEELIAAITAQTDGVTPEDLHFLPSAEKWLRNRGWESKASLKSQKTGGEKKSSQIVRAADYKPPKNDVSPTELAALIDKI